MSKAVLDKQRRKKMRREKKKKKNDDDDERLISTEADSENSMRRCTISVVSTGDFLCDHAHVRTLICS